MAIEKKDYKDFGFFVKHCLDAHSKGEITDKLLIEFLKKELDKVKKDQGEFES